MQSKMAGVLGREDFSRPPTMTGWACKWRAGRVGFSSWALCILTGSLFTSTVTDLQEEGKSAINSPMAPALVDIHPEDTQLGTVVT